MTRDATTAFARALVDEWARAGVQEACVAPGSRSAPLALALAADERIRVHVHLDERSAAFFALGTAKASGSPAVVLCTSGTAAANFHPAVLEASHARTPLIVCTADRPPELRDTGAGQTVDQLDLYGRAVRWFCEVGVPGDHPGAGASWRSTAARAVAESLGPPPGPVHLNLAFREPLVPTGAPLVDAPGRPDGLSVDVRDRADARARRGDRGAHRGGGAHSATRADRGRLGERCVGRRRRPLRRGRRVAGARRPDLRSSSGSARGVDVRGAAAQPPGSPSGTAPNSCSASARRRRASRSRRGSVPRSRNFSSTPTRHGSTRVGA